ncbi:Aldose 1-epimerase [Heracleum sosnowskyi]|uniref:Aldose 1-epimerase n=1 Tax=Heracleum sosnowskyi TaxID=360622 RepID=A0AAD8HUA6_9APIA|nr:Aldose 1-epimerase [Heracleum sosnowskyi]
MAKLSILIWVILVVTVLFQINLSTAANKGGDVGVYEIKRRDFSIKVTNYGATVLSVMIPDKNGKIDDVVLGFDSVEDYSNDTTYFGALVGRVANRIGNARFTLNGVLYKLSANDGNNTLHGGKNGFSEKIWTVEDHKPDSHITLTYNSPDGQNGFPGDVAVSVTYIFMGTNKLAVKMKANPKSKATPINLASHTYWNLAGQDSGDILSHSIQLLASKITPVDDALIPTGQIVPVSGTAYDFLQPRNIGSKINDLSDGYDINYVLDGTSKKHLNKAAIVHDSKSGRKMELWTNKPGVQFYTSNMVHNVKGKLGFVYQKYAGLCLETQGFPDSVNHPSFPSQIVNPGETYEHIMVYRFTAE